MRGDAAPPTDLVSRPQSPPPLASPTTEGEPLWLAAQGGGITLTAGRRLSAGDPPTANTVALLGPPHNLSAPVEFCVRLAEHFGMDYIAIGLATADATLRGAAILGGAEHPSGAALGFHLLGSMRWAYDGHFDGPTDFPDSRVGDVFRFRYDPDLLTATVDLNGTRLQAYNLLDGGMRGPVHVAVLFEGRGAVDLLDGDFSAAAEPPPSPGALGARRRHRRRGGASPRCTRAHAAGERRQVGGQVARAAAAVAAARAAAVAAPFAPQRAAARAPAGGRRRPRAAAHPAAVRGGGGGRGGGAGGGAGGGGPDGVGGGVDGGRRGGTVQRALVAAAGRDADDPAAGGGGGVEGGGARGDGRAAHRGARQAARALPQARRHRRRHAVRARARPPRLLVRRVRAAAAVDQPGAGGRHAGGGDNARRPQGARAARVEGGVLDVARPPH